MTNATTAMPSATTVASNRFVAAHIAGATALGQRLADLVADPGDFVSALTSGFAEISDPGYAEGQRLVAPGLGPVLGVRLPLMDAVQKAFKRGTRNTSTAQILDIADRLLREEAREARWFGMWNLARLLPSDPERTWQLLRRAASEADDWISVDTLAHPYAEGILRDRRRWAEIEQLVYSPSRWERRLVGSTLAAMPHVKFPGNGDRLRVGRGLALVEQLIGDAEPDVQKALSWALRTYAQLDPAAVTAFAQAEARAAWAANDGNRAWVIRDSLSKLPDDTATDLRAAMDGIRRRPGAPSTSRAAAAAAQLLPQPPTGTARADEQPRRTSAK